MKTLIILLAGLMFASFLQGCLFAAGAVVGAAAVGTAVIVTAEDSAEVVLAEDKDDVYETIRDKLARDGVIAYENDDTHSVEAVVNEIRITARVQTVNDAHVKLIVTARHQVTQIAHPDMARGYAEYVEEEVR